MDENNTLTHDFWNLFDDVDLIIHTSCLREMKRKMENEQKEKKEKKWHEKFQTCVYHI